MPTSRLVSAKVVADHFGVTIETVNRWVRERRIPHVRPSRRIVRFRLHEVIEALHARGTEVSR